MQIEIHIGEVTDITDPHNPVKKPKQTMIITEDQLMIVEMFASTKKDAGLNTIYRLNDVEFTIHRNYFIG